MAINRLGNMHLGTQHIIVVGDGVVNLFKEPFNSQAEEEVVIVLSDNIIKFILIL